MTTRNRKYELGRALKSAFAAAPLEVLVIDDASDDGTAEMVRAEFPAVKLYRFEEQKGVVVRRNQAARLATCELIVSIDDDAVFSTPRVVEQTLRDFADTRIGAVAIPYIEPHKDNRVLQLAPDREQVWITDRFIGTAYAVRRDVFLRLGGYREAIVHQGEEGDFCIRMMNAGYFIRLGNANVIEHYESPRRNFRRMDYYGARNAVIYAWQNVPMPMMPVHLAATSAKCAIWSLAPRRLLVRLSALLSGCAAMARFERSPVSRAAYRLAQAAARWSAAAGGTPATLCRNPASICREDAVDNLTWFWLWWGLTVGLVAWQIAGGLLDAKRALGFPVIAGLMWLYIYGLLPFSLIQSEAAMPPILPLAQFLPFAAYASLLIGWNLRLSRSSQLETPYRNAPLDAQKLSNAGVGLALAGMVGYLSFRTSGQALSESSAYWYLLFHVCYPGISICVATMTISPSPGRLRNLVLSGLSTAPVVLSELGAATSDPRSRPSSRSPTRIFWSGRGCLGQRFF